MRPHRLNTYTPVSLTQAVHTAMGAGEVADWLLAYIHANYEPKPISRDVIRPYEPKPISRDVIRPEDDPDQLLLFDIDQN